MDNKKTILVTGCNGFIASCFIRKYRNHYNIIGLDIIEPLDKNRCDRQYIGDICDMTLVNNIFKEHDIDIVIHTAAEKSLAICESNKERAYDVNYIASINLSKIASANNAKFIFISSDQVFNGKSPYSSENSPVDPINYYGKLKTMVESELVKAVGVSICRTALVFGEIPDEQKEYFDSIKSSETLAVQGFIVQQTRYCLENNLPILLPDDEFVSPTHVSLLSDQINSVIINDVVGILHCCGNDRISRYEMGLAIAEHYGCQTDMILSCGVQDHLRPKDVSLSCKMSERSLHMEFPNFRNMLHKYM